MACKHGNTAMYCGWCEDQADLTEARKALEAFQRRAFETLDCRTCRHFRGTAHCHSVLRCVAGSSYQKTAPIQLWEEAPLADPGF
mgnify:CR=1 FL=1